MKIVHVLTRLLTAGAEENTLATCFHQKDEGHDVYLIYGNEYDEGLLYRAEEYGVVCQQVPKMVAKIDPVKDFSATLQLRKLLRAKEPDLVHTHQSKAGILARLACFRTSGVVVHTVHIVPFENIGIVKKWLYVLAERLCSRVTDYFIDVSKGTKETYLKYAIGTESNHEVVYSGMNIDKFIAKKSTNTTAAESLLISSTAGAFKVMMVAAFQDRKRHKQLVTELADVLRNQPEVEVYFLGRGENESEIKSLVNSLSLSDQIKFLGYVKDPENYLCQADLGVLVSEREGLPRVFVQFIACGVPVISTWLPGIEEIVRNNSNGIVHGPNDISSVARDIGVLSREKSRYDQLRAGALGTDVERWNLNLMGPRIIDVYQKAFQRNVVSG